MLYMKKNIGRFKSALLVPAGNTPRQEVGAILFLVLILMVVLMISSAGFFGRASDSSNISGFSRDASQASLLAESGLNRVLGSFNNKTSLTIGDVDGNSILDRSGINAALLGNTLTAPALPLILPARYWFYRSSGTAIDQTAPSLLQLVASGEATNADAASASALINQKVDTAVTALRVNDLFDGAVKPVLFTQTSSGLTLSAAAWNAEPGTEKVAVWMELTQNPAQNTCVDFFISAAAQVAQSKSYVQRFVLTACPNNTLGSNPPLQDASNLPRT